MAVAAATRKGGLTRYFMGPRIGTGMIVVGIVLAVAAAVLVLQLGRRAGIAPATAPEVQTVQVAYVVVASRDIPESTSLTADSIAVRAFPAAYAPAGAAATLEEVVGKFATTRLVREQIVLTTQLSTTRRAGSLATGVPPGKLAVWMALPELSAQTGGLRAGDRIDLLFSVSVPAPVTSGASGASGTAAQPSSTVAVAYPSGDAPRALATQLTLQNVEVFSIGAANASPPPLAGGIAGPPPATSPQPAATQAADSKIALLLLDPQDALVAKFVKDSGGTVDIALRSREWPDVVTTEPVTIDSVVHRFGFRKGAAQ